MHVGEVELVGQDVRGVAVHEAARIMGAAGEDEILVSDLTRVLAAGAGVAFEDRSQEALKGLDGEWRLSRTRARPGPGELVTGSGDTRPLILAVEPDAASLARITGELARYERDYQVVCSPSPEAALAQLQSCASRARASPSSWPRAVPRAASAARSCSSASARFIRTRSAAC